MFLEFLRIPKGAHVLEVGCGDGRFTKYLLKAGYRVTGLDLSEKILDRIRRGVRGTEYESNLTLVSGNGEELPFQDGAFDACLCVHVLHHTKDIGYTVGEMSRGLKPGGIMGAVEPNPYCPYWYIYIPLAKTKKWAVEKGLIRCTSENLRRLMRKAGLERIERKMFGFIPSVFMKERRWMARLERMLCDIPIFKYVAGAHFFRAIKR